ncbi:hypothetical protein TSOC_002774 [Tetrabaena socialis]|uniref:Uncharacterized protein n=1 Tax=Tetrabaena socialis TaxID=47790 RepID=A0A2J8ADA4_9CHLO|nr:hypothetical protein TSOC_002774 [Tetrabaena socialis]|eukprot:PNH10502.1 hypothetical protein TSOC_002774 [Tetrabaena socialis]
MADQALSPRVAQLLLLIAAAISIAVVPVVVPVARADEDLAGSSVRAVSSGAELAAAIADERISLVLAGADLTLADSDWVGYPVPVPLRRNLTIRGSAAPRASWPQLTLPAKQKVQLLDGVTLRLEYLILYKYRSDNPLRAPGTQQPTF